jgi:hypothetical protein
MTNLSATIAWTSNVWHQIGLAYSPTGSALFVDGSWVVNGTGVAYYPNAADLNNGFRIGGDQNGTNQARGVFDELKTFRSPLTGIGDPPSETYWSGIPDYQADPNGILGNWEMQYFGHLGLNPSADYDNDGNSLLQDFQKGIDPAQFLIDVDFGSAAYSSKTGYAAIGDSSGDFWNYYIPGGNVVAGSVTNLETAEGMVTWTGLAVTNLPAAGTNGSADAMYGHYLSTNSGSATLTLTSVPAGTWNFFLYANDGNFTLSVGTNSYGTQTCYDGSPGSNPVAWQQGVQYVEFQNVFVTNGQPVTVIVSPGQSGVTRISGLQIASISHSPPQFSSLSSVIAWGNNSYGQTNVPANLSNVVAVAAGSYHNLVLESNGEVVAWGYNGYGETTVPAGLSNVVAIAGGGYHSVALESNGTVVAWGQNTYGQTNVPANLTNAAAIAGGFLHSLALKSNGTVVAWGYNGNGQTNVPAGLNNVVAVAGGGFHSLALRSNGTMVAWGYNGYGQTNVPASLTNVMAIAGGYYHSLALRSNGTVVAWGYNGYGQTNVPAGLTNVVAIAAGGYHNLALKNDGTVLAWGYNGYGQTNIPAGLNRVLAVAGGLYHSLVFRIPPDSDYDGVDDYQETVDRTNPNDASSVWHIRLGYWPFDNTNTWAGSAGQLPLMATNVTGVPSWNTNAVLIDSTNAAILTYRDVETNGNANINLCSGTVRFWFKPDWSGTNAGGVGPQNEGRLLEMGTKGSTNGWWGLVVNSAGTNIYFGTQTNSTSTLTTNLIAPISWTSNNWHQIVLAYNSTNSSLYLDGQPAVTNGTGVAYYPGLNIRNYGFTIGSSALGTNQAGGTYDELETFNYAKTAAQILSDFNAAADNDGDGVLNWQDAAPNNPNIGILIITIDNPISGATIY